MGTNEIKTPIVPPKGIKITLHGQNGDWPGIAFIASTCIADAPNIKGFEGLPEDFGSFLVKNNLMDASTVAKITTDLGLTHSTTHLGAIKEVSELPSVPTGTPTIAFNIKGKPPTTEIS